MKSSTKIPYYRFAAALFVAALLPAAAALHAQTPDHAAAVPRRSGEAGLRFTENRGQLIDARGALRPDLLYSAEANGARIYFRRDAISYVFMTVEGDLHEYLGRIERHDADEESGGASPDASPILHTYRMDMELIGANPMARVEGESITTERGNYYLAHCPAGAGGVRSYRRLLYRDLYPNIDMVVNAGETGMKCDFIVRPGGDPSSIRMRYAGGAAALLDDGTLRVGAPVGSMTMQAPYSYQQAGMIRSEVASRYTSDDGVIGFDVGTYDRSRPLVIDPYQRWGTYFGGALAEEVSGGNTCAIDRLGNVLLAGSTWSTAATFPLTPGASQSSLAGQSDAFVAKLSPDGALLWSTYWGGTGGEALHGVACDTAGNVVVCGHWIGSAAGTIPLMNAIQAIYGGGARDAIVAKFSPSGEMLWGTLLGGDEWDDAYGLAVDSAGNACMGLTTSSDIAGVKSLNGRKPNAAGSSAASYDGLLVKFSASGLILWSYYYGGTGMEYIYSVAADRRENILITGFTASSSGFPVFGAAQTRYGGGLADAFVAKFTGRGVLQWSTYYGGDGTENYVQTNWGTTINVGFSAIACDTGGNAYVVGATSGRIPTSGDVFQRNMPGGNVDGFCVKFDSVGTLQWATYVGSAGRDILVSVAPDAGGGAVMAGETNSSAFPVTRPPVGEQAFQSTYQGGIFDAVIVKLSSDGGMKWGSYFGGTDADYAQGIALGPNDKFAIAGITTSIPQPDFPGPNGFQMENKGGHEAFVTLFCDIDTPAVAASGPLTFDSAAGVILSVAPGYAGVRWYRAGAPASVIATTDSLTVRESGTWYAVVTNNGGCEATSATIETTRRTGASAPPAADPEWILWLSGLMP